MRSNAQIQFFDYCRCVYSSGYARPHRPAPCPLSNWGERALCPATRLRPARLTQDFFAIWKDADPAIPILKEAKAEYGKLQ